MLLAHNIGRIDQHASPVHQVSPPTLDYCRIALAAQRQHEKRDNTAMAGSDYAHQGLGDSSHVVHSAGPQCLHRLLYPAAEMDGTVSCSQKAIRRCLEVARSAKDDVRLDPSAIWNLRSGGPRFRWA